MDIKEFYKYYNENTDRFEEIDSPNIKSYCLTDDKNILMIDNDNNAYFNGDKIGNLTDIEDETTKSEYCTKSIDNIEEKLDQADAISDIDPERLYHDDIFNSELTDLEELINDEIFLRLIKNKDIIYIRELEILLFNKENETLFALYNIDKNKFYRLINDEEVDMDCEVELFFI